MEIAVAIMEDVSGARTAATVVTAIEIYIRLTAIQERTHGTINWVFRPALPTEASLRRDESCACTFVDAIADAPAAAAASEVVVTVVAIGIFCAFWGASGMWVCGESCAPPVSLCRCFSALAAALDDSFELDLDDMSLEDVLVDELSEGDGDDFALESSFFRPDSLIFAPGMADEGTAVG
uniref:Uncharacterized protein n=1 Tax=Anopheles culicifacies TaxID=139723 RepID=A0A182MVU8_9DIPT